MDIAAIFQEYISVVALVVCACVGYIVKHVVPSDTVDRFIPLIVGVLGVAIVAWTKMAVTPDVLALGLVSGLASTGAYEAIDQMRLLNYERKTEGMAADPMELADEEDGE